MPMVRFWVEYPYAGCPVNETEEFIDAEEGTEEFTRLCDEIMVDHIGASVEAGYGVVGDDDA